MLNCDNEKKLFYRSVAALAIPIALQNLINVGVNSTDVLILGRVNEKVLSAASLASQVQFIMTLIFFGLTSGATILNAQYWGKKDVHTIERILGISIKFTLIVSSIFLLITFLFSHPIMSLLSNDQEVIAEGSKYLRIVCWSYIVTSLTMVYLNTLRSVERVYIATIVYFISFSVNLILNIFLVYGIGDFQGLGIQGSALSTLISRCVEFLIIVLYDRKWNAVFQFKWKLLFGKNPLLRKDFMKYSVPVILNELMWGSGIAVIAAILGHMGSSASAANSVAQVVRQLATVASFGVAAAAAVMIGKIIGEGKIETAKLYAKRFMKASLIIGLCGAVLVLCIRPVILSNLKMTEQASSYLSVMIFVMAYYVIGQSLNTTVVVGILRAGGDSKYGLVLDVSVMWLLSILSGGIAAFVLDASVPLVYILLLSDEIIKIPFCIWRYRSYHWLRNITR